MSDMQYSPETKMLIKDTLYAFMYDRLEKKWQQKLDNVIQRNSLHYGNHQEYVMFRGTLLSSSTASLPSPRPVNPVHPDLQKEFDDLDAAKQWVNTQEFPFVIGYINQILNSTASFEDYYRLLPEALHPTLNKLKRECPCQHNELSDAVVTELMEKNKKGIEQIKQRLLSNLLMG